MIMEATGLDNDARGWIMTAVSGIACVLGASVICVDIIVRRFPSCKDFRIQDNNAFLACSLSLSFGVMLFMSLYSMLPSSKKYLKKGGFSEQVAGFALIGCFVGGFIGIQILSRLFHQFLPSHVVDCDHTHEEQPSADDHAHDHQHSRRASSRPKSIDRRHRHSTVAKTHICENGKATESTPLLPNDDSSRKQHPLRRADTISNDHPSHDDGAALQVTRGRSATQDRRPSMAQVQQRVVSFVKDTKANCDELGPCFGYSDPCGQECFKHINTRAMVPSRAPTFLRTTTYSTDIEPVDEDADRETSSGVSPLHGSRRTSHEVLATEEQYTDESEDLEAQHHHHVPKNAFLSIGLQTSIAIALHKFPEGFITYTTNHANPALGFNVFLAIFVHNVSEGFAMALPLYMALNNRFQAMLWSFVLGGLSQPFGAGIAAIWFKLADRSHMEPDDVAYGCLFAITSGIMASVALQLFVESLSLNHNRNLSIVFAFLGMTLLGLSNAFTSDAH